MPPTLNDFFTVGCVMFFNLHFVCFCLGFSFEFLSSSFRMYVAGWVVGWWGEGEKTKGRKRNWKQKYFPLVHFVALPFGRR